MIIYLHYKLGFGPVLKPGPPLHDLELVQGSILLDEGGRGLL